MTALGSALLAASAVALLVHLLGRAPAFYRQIDRLAAEDQGSQSRQFIRRTTGLWNEIENEPTWSSTFREVQVNAWLARDFAAKHGGVLPRGVSEPRVSFDSGRLALAFRMKRGPVTTIMSVVSRVWLPEPNTIAIEFERVRAGVIPLPSNQVIETLSSAARSAHLDVEWRQHAGNPVAIIRLFSADRRRGFEIEQVELEQGALHIAGRSHEIGAIGQHPPAPRGSEPTGVSLNDQLSGPTLNK